MTEQPYPELPPLRDFDFVARTKILEHKLHPLVDDAIIHRLENDHEVIDIYRNGLIPVVRFRVLFGLREYSDFVVSDDYRVVRFHLLVGESLQSGRWFGEGLVHYVRSVIDPGFKIAS